RSSSSPWPRRLRAANRENDRAQRQPLAGLRRQASPNSDKPAERNTQQQVFDHVGLPINDRNGGEIGRWRLAGEQFFAEDRHPLRRLDSNANPIALNFQHLDDDGFGDEEPFASLA